jgi:hypothetical protein
MGKRSLREIERFEGGLLDSSFEGNEAGVVTVKSFESWNNRHPLKCYEGIAGEAPIGDGSRRGSRKLGEAEGIEGIETIGGDVLESG